MLSDILAHRSMTNSVSLIGIMSTPEHTDPPPPSATPHLEEAPVKDEAEGATRPTTKKRGLPAGDSDQKSFHIKLEWELVGKEGDAKTIRTNDVFTVPVAVLRLNPYEATVVHVNTKYLIVHARMLEGSHPDVDLGRSVYIFFSGEFLQTLRDAIPRLPDPDPRLKDPSRNHAYPNGYMLQNASPAQSS